MDSKMLAIDLRYLENRRVNRSATTCPLFSLNECQECLAIRISDRYKRSKQTKGQLISEWNFGLFKANQILDSFIGQKFVKHLVACVGDLKTPKFHSEINWP